MKIPIFIDEYILIKQYNESCVYKRFESKKNIYTSGELIFDKINKYAAEILELSDGTRDISEIVNELCTNYKGNTAEEIYSYVEEFLTDVEERGYVTYLKDKNKKRIYDNVKGSFDTIYPIFAALELTKNCPLKCKHCFNNSGEKKEDEMSIDEILSIISNLADMGVQKIMLTGGEVTSIKGIERVINESSNKFLGITVGTNGYLVDEKFIEKIKNTNNNVIFQVSVDGLEKNHDFLRGVKGSFNKAMNAIELLCRYGFIVTVSTTVNKHNIDDIYELTKLVKEKGARQITIAMTMETGRAENNDLLSAELYSKYDELIEKIYKNYNDDFFCVNKGEEESYINDVDGNCGCGQSQICIRANGDVSPCVHYPIVYGNLRKERKEDVFHYSRVKVFGDDNLKYGECKKCGKCMGCQASMVKFNDKSCKILQDNSDFYEQISKFKRIDI